MAAYGVLSHTLFLFQYFRTELSVMCVLLCIKKCVKSTFAYYLNNKQE